MLLQDRVASWVYLSLLHKDTGMCWLIAAITADWTQARHPSGILSAMTEVTFDVYAVPMHI